MKNREAALEEQARNFFEKLPGEICDFNLKKIFAESDDKFIYFAFENEKKHRSATAYFHEETSEFKLRVKIGLSEFCLTDFFTEDFDRFGEMISAQLEGVLKNISENKNSNPIIQEKNFPAWEYGKNLPKNIEGFELFISPQQPIPFTNGSHILINYSDFEISSDLSIYYNIYSDNFSGETRIKNVPNVIYSFDSANIKELENKLSENLASELSAIRNAK